MLYLIARKRLKPLDELFNLECPAAMVRGQGEGNRHGEEVDGRFFFGAEDAKELRFATVSQSFAWLYGGL